MPCRLDLKCINLLTPKSDKHLISPNIITPKSNIKLMTIREMTPNLRSPWLLDKFSLQAPEEMYRERYGERV